jgi:hypothetical protein
MLVLPKNSLLSTTTNIFFVASDQGIIVNAMNTLMYAVGTPVQGQTSRRSCVYFRPKLSNENNFVKIVYGTGCSGTVNNHIIF